jgi:glycosyltransferase involved in cell wall biosynthesis
MKRISIIIPAYNEERRIGRTLKEYSRFFENLSEKNLFDYEIVVIINNTKDKTEEIVKEAMNKDKKIRYLNLPEPGKGNAVINGFADALKRENDFIGFVDADMATGPKEFFALVKNIGNYGGCIASRYMKGSVIQPSFNFRRKIVAKIFNFLVRSLFSIKIEDTQCGAKLFNREAAKIIKNFVKMSQWAFDVELIYILKKKGFTIKEIPTFWREVDGGSIRIVRASIQMALAVIQLRIIESRFKRIFRQFKPLIKIIFKVVK